MRVAGWVNGAPIDVALKGWREGNVALKTCLTALKVAKNMMMLWRKTGVSFVVLVTVSLSKGVVEAAGVRFVLTTQAISVEKANSG